MRCFASLSLSPVHVIAVHPSQTYIYPLFLPRPMSEMAVTENESIVNDKIMNRWLVVIGAIMIQLALGAIYSWSVFTPILTEVGGEFEFTTTQTQMIFSAGLVNHNHRRTTIRPKPIRGTTFCPGDFNDAK